MITAEHIDLVCDADYLKDVATPEEIESLKKHLNESRIYREQQNEGIRKEYQANKKPFVPMYKRLEIVEEKLSKLIMQ